jgi:hypothetical protein
MLRALWLIVPICSFLLTFTSAYVTCKLDDAERRLQRWPATWWDGLATALGWIDWGLGLVLYESRGVLWMVVLVALPSVLGSMAGTNRSVHSNFVAERLRRKLKREPSS